MASKVAGSTEKSNNCDRMMLLRMEPENIEFITHIFLYLLNILPVLGGKWGGQSKKQLQKTKFNKLCQTSLKIDFHKTPSWLCEKAV